MSRSLLAFCALGALTLTACATTPPYTAPDDAPYAVVEPVLAWRQNAAGDLVVRVFSNGCTNKDSFDAVATGSPRAGWAFDVTLTRHFPDTCEAILPQGVELVWMRDELGLPESAQMSLTNPVDTYRSVPIHQAPVG
jgi:hypothetical protein